MNANFTLRAAQNTDQPAIKELIYANEVNPMGVDWHRFVVVENSKGEVIGCGQIKPHGQEVLELASIVVKAGYRNQGVARAIIEHLLDGSPRPLYLMCRSKLEPFYEKFGFRALTQEEMPRYFRRISKLAGWVEAVAVHGTGAGLSVMKLQ